MAELPARPLGDSVLQVSIAGLGCNNFGRRIDLEATRGVGDPPIEEGITFFDTANIYGRGASEEFLARTSTACSSAKRNATFCPPASVWGSTSPSARC